MSRVIKIRLTPQNASALRVLQEREPVVLEDLVNRALNDCLFRLRFDQLRAKLSKATAVRAAYTEDEILDLVS